MDRIQLVAATSLCCSHSEFSPNELKLDNWWRTECRNKNLFINKIITLTFPDISCLFGALLWPSFHKLFFGPSCCVELNWKHFFLVHQINWRLQFWATLAGYGCIVFAKTRVTQHSGNTGESRLWLQTGLHHLLCAKVDIFAQKYKTAVRFKGYTMQLLVSAECNV